MRIRHLFCNFLLLLTAFQLSSCALLVAAGSATGAAMYYRGQLKATRNATLDQAWHATTIAFQTLEMTLVEKKRDGLYARFSGRRVDNARVEIDIKKIEEDVIAIRIRVGILGDEEQARIILSQIERRLYDNPRQIKTGAGGIAPTLPAVGLNIHNQTK